MFVRIIMEVDDPDEVGRLLYQRVKLVQQDIGATGVLLDVEASATPFDPAESTETSTDLHVRR